MSDYIIGRNAVMERLRSGQGIEKIYIQKGERKGSVISIIAKAKDQRIPVVEIDRQKLTEMAQEGSHQGVIALVTDYITYEVEDLIAYAEEKGQAPFLVILDGIEDPHNLGAIIRTAECAGVHGIIIPKRHSASVTSTVHKTSAGATQYMKIAKVSNVSETISRLKEKNIWVYGADGDTTRHYTEVSLSGAVCLVIGNEGSGLSRLVKERCDELIKIPMMGQIGSLNASNAAAILMYEVVRQNHG